MLLHRKLFVREHWIIHSALIGIALGVLWFPHAQARPQNRAQTKSTEAGSPQDSRVSRLMEMVRTEAIKPWEQGGLGLNDDLAKSLVERFTQGKNPWLDLPERAIRVYRETLQQGKEVLKLDFPESVKLADRAVHYSYYREAGNYVSRFSEAYQYALRDIRHGGLGLNGIQAQDRERALSFAFEFVSSGSARPIRERLQSHHEWMTLAMESEGRNGLGMEFDEAVQFATQKGVAQSQVIQRFQEIYSAGRSLGASPERARAFADRNIYTPAGNSLVEKAKRANSRKKESCIYNRFAQALKRFKSEN